MWLRQKDLIAMKIEFVGSVSHLNAKCLNSEVFWFIKRQEGRRLNLSVMCCIFIFPQRCQHHVNLSLSSLALWKLSVVLGEKNGSLARPEHHPAP